jgi:hypothetical protein
MTAGRRGMRPQVPAAPAVALLLAVAGLAAGCTVNGSVAALHTVHQTFSVTGAPLVVVDTFNGRIGVAAGRDETIDARVTSRGSGTSDADAQNDLQKVQVTIDRTEDRIVITARRTDRPISLGNSGADVEVTVPAGCALELRTSNGRIEAANTTSSIVARTSNGAITTRGGNDLNLDTTNGPLSVNNAIGHLVLRTSNGPLDVVAARDALVDAQTSNAGLSFSGSLTAGADSFETSNGDVSLTLPGDSAFSITGTTSNGAVRTDLPGLQLTDTSISGATGQPPILTSIRAETSNGDLAVMVQRP